MTAVSVLVPYRPDGGHRDTAWAWLQRWWASNHPQWQLVTGACSDGPWVKAHAVGDALSRADGDVLVVADADVFCEGVGLAVEAAHRGAPWAIPHGKVYRLAESATASVIAGAAPSPALAGLERESYMGVEGGGIAVLTRDAYQAAPMDPRFVGWNNEDLAWATALRTLVGAPWRGVAPLWHLHHPPAPRLNAHVGDKVGRALHVRYQYAAKAGPAAMRALINEFETTVGAP
jgi:hypothetical protein